MESTGTQDVNLSVRPSVWGDCVVLSQNLREADHNEVQAALGTSDLEALLSAWSQSERPFTIVDGKTPAGIFGVVPIQPNVGCVWLVGTDAIAQGRWTFLRQSRRWLTEVSKDYGLLFNYVDERNTLHIKWIEWLGFTVIARHQHYGHEQRPFLEFVRIC